ncbi:MAG: SDR family oxidoreductase [Actinobacteria bacterium]|nr:SDR family oxidoreductase [Actinomycetota bacterium]MSZ37271.1 SDR family oxidoreductase [Actinomycetota bacterium]MSZ99161.1 SDR family oxidoreductase [Actinomycetota bacterium]
MNSQANFEHSSFSGRVGKPPDIASAALYLTSDLSAFVNGRTLVIDGGIDAKFPYNTL